MRGFPDLESREPLKAQFYEGDPWKRELEQKLLPMIEKYDVVLVEESIRTEPPQLPLDAVFRTLGSRPKLFPADNHIACQCTLMVARPVEPPACAVSGRDQLRS